MTRMQQLVALVVVICSVPDILQLFQRTLASVTNKTNNTRTHTRTYTRAKSFAMACCQRAHARKYEKNGRRSSLGCAQNSPALA
jgi:hypothetical protein